MANTTPTTSRTLVSRIPIRSASTCKPASYKSVRRYNLKDKGPPTPDTSSSASPRSRTLTPPTSGNASPDAPKTIARKLNKLKTNDPGPPTSAPTVSQSTPQPTISNTPATYTSKPTRLNHKSSPTSPSPQPSTPHPLLLLTQSLLHTHLETLMQTLHHRLLTLPHLSPSHVRAFEDLAADTLYAGMGERIHADVLYRRGERKVFVAGLEGYLRREGARNARRYLRGMNFLEEYDRRSESDGGELCAC